MVGGVEGAELRVDVGIDLRKGAEPCVEGLVERLVVASALVVEPSVVALVAPVELVVVVVDVVTFVESFVVVD